MKQAIKIIQQRINSLEEDRYTDDAADNLDARLYELKNILDQLKQIKEK